jgi:hypothetical protein
VAIFLVQSGLCEESCPEDTFSTTAAALDTTQIASVLLLAEHFTALANNLPESCNERLFLIFRNAYYDAMKDVNTAKSISAIAYPIASELLSALNTELNQVGWQIDELEGTYFIGETGDWFRGHFGSVLPESWDMYFGQREQEIVERTARDHGLQVSWDTVRRRMIAWEQFLQRYPDFPLQEDISRRIRTYLSILLNGLDNSRIDAWPESRTLRDDVRETYEAFLLYNAGSQYYDLVKGYYDILKKYNFSTSQESRMYIETVGGMSSPVYWPSDKD